VALVHDRVLVQLEDPFGRRPRAGEARLHLREVPSPQRALVLERAVPRMSREVFIPGRTQRVRRLPLARLGDVVLLHRELLVELPDVRRRLGVGLLGLPRGPEERGAVHPLERVFHPLSGEDAAVVVLQDALRAPAESVHRAQRHESEQRKPRGKRQLCQEQPGPQRHARPSWSRKDTTCRSNSSASRNRRVTTDPRRICLHQGWSDLPTMTCATPCVRAKSSNACAGSAALRRTTSAPSSLALSMLASRCRCASASIRCGASSGVSTYTTYQSVFSRPAMREPRARSVFARGGLEARQTITRPAAFSSGSRLAAPARSRLSATSRSASSRSVARLWSLKKFSSAQGIFSVA